MQQRQLRIGYISALISFIVIVGYAVAQIAQVAGVVRYPLDAILIYGFSLAIAAPFLSALLVLHYKVPVDKQFWTHAALLFAVMYNVFVTIMYVVQLTVVIPYDVKDTALVVQPHSFFWTLDALGYIAMGVATLFAAFAFSSEQRVLKNFFLANAFTTPLIAFVYFYPNFSVGVLFIASPFIITAPGAMLALAIYFRHEGQAMMDENHSQASREFHLSASLKIS